MLYWRASTLLKHKGTILLETERLLLCRFTMEDAEAMYRNWGSDEEVYRYLRAKPHKTIEVPLPYSSDGLPAMKIQNSIGG